MTNPLPDIDWNNPRIQVTAVCVLLLIITLYVHISVSITMRKYKRWCKTCKVGDTFEFGSIGTTRAYSRCTADPETGDWKDKTFIYVRTNDTDIIY